jgi:hypothetical protein
VVALSTLAVALLRIETKRAIHFSMLFVNEWTALRAYHTQHTNAKGVDKMLPKERAALLSAQAVAGLGPRKSEDTNPVPQATYI